MLILGDTCHSSSPIEVMPHVYEFAALTPTNVLTLSDGAILSGA